MTKRERKAQQAVAVGTRETSSGDVRREVERLRRELAELQRVHRLQDQYLSVAAHELATPLTSIKAYVETLVENWGAPDFTQGVEFLKVLQRETSRLIRIVERTLQLSRLTSNSQTVQPVPVRLHELVEEVGDSLRPVLAERQITLEIQVPQELPAIRADRDLLEQALINLLDNAAKFSPRGRAVSLRAASNGSQIEIRVHDEGYGIAPDELQRIFDPYFRSRDGRVGHERGTGLGLALVKAVVEQHGGQVRVESEIDRGTTFRFSLPHA